MKPELCPSVYMEDDQVKKNIFLTKEVEAAPIPEWEKTAHLLPRPVWDGHEDSIAAYDHAWQLALRNLHNPDENNGFVSPYLDAAFSNDIFMWDSCFMLMFGIYADHLFPFQKTLDNFYASQLTDGFISRQIHESNGQAKWMRFDPVSTGPNLLGWCEWEYYLRTGNKERLGQVYAPIRAYHRWLQRNRTWQNGTYWSTGWGSGMDNQPRFPQNAGVDAYYGSRYHHGWMSWIDTNLQQVLSCDILLKIIRELNLDEDTAELEEEQRNLTEYINEHMWSEKDGFYYDRYRDGTLAKAKTIGAYWALMTDVAPKQRQERMISHLTDEKIFARPHPVPTLSYDSKGYAEDGNYWCGGVWAPVNYMVPRRLSRCGRNELAVDIARKHYDQVMAVWRDTGTFWENYAPEYTGRGGRSKPDFVGWTGLTPITIFLEYVLGIQMDVPGGVIHWYISNTERHGVENLHFGDRQVSLMCEARSSADETPTIHTTGCEGIRVEIHLVK